MTNEMLASEAHDEKSWWITFLSWEQLQFSWLLQKKKKKKQFYGKHTFPFLMMLLMVFWPLCVCVLRDLRRDLGPKKIFVD